MIPTQGTTWTHYHITPDFFLSLNNNTEEVESDEREEMNKSLMQTALLGERHWDLRSKPKKSLETEVWHKNEKRVRG